MVCELDNDTEVIGKPKLFDNYQPKVPTLEFVLV